MLHVSNRLLSLAVAGVLAAGCAGTAAEEHEVVTGGPDAGDRPRPRSEPTSPPSPARAPVVSVQSWQHDGHVPLSDIHVIGTRVVFTGVTDVAVELVGLDRQRVGSPGRARPQCVRGTVVWRSTTNEGSSWS